MKQTSIIFLLFICTVCMNKYAAAQEPVATKVKADTTKEITIVCTSTFIEPEFSGGDSAWQRFVTRLLVYPPEAKRKKIQGIVTVQFIVDKEGYVADVEAISGPEELRQSAVSVVKKSPKWCPAIQRGRIVAGGKKVEIAFKLKTE